MDMTRLIRGGKPLGALLTAALLLSACGGGEEQPQTGNGETDTTRPAATGTATTDENDTPAEAQQIVVQSGAPSPNITDLPVYIGQEAGFFADEGLEVEVQYGEGGSLAAQLVSNQQADIATNTFEPVIAGYGEGLRGKVFFEVNNRVTYYITVLENSDVQALTDLEGATIGAASLGSTAIPIAQIMLDRAGVDPGTVEFLPVGVGASATAALEDGSVDALAMWNGAFAAIEASGTDMRELRDDELAAYGNGGTWTSDAFIESSPELLEGYSRALAKSLMLIHEHPEVATEMYFAVNPEAESVGLEEIMGQIQYVARDFDQERPLGELDLAGANEFIQLYAEAQGIEDPPAAEDIMTNQFIEAANDFDEAEVTEAAEAYQR